MPKKRTLALSSVWDRPAVLQAFTDASVKSAELHATRLWSHLSRHPHHSWHDVPDFPKAAKAALDAGFAMSTTKLQAVQRSGDDSTLKLLLQFQDGLQVRGRPRCVCEIVVTAAFARCGHVMHRECLKVMLRGSGKVSVRHSLFRGGAALVRCVSTCCPLAALLPLSMRRSPFVRTWTGYTLTCKPAVPRCNST